MCTKRSCAARISRAVHAASAVATVKAAKDVAADEMILDIGPKTAQALAAANPPVVLGCRSEALGARRELGPALLLMVRLTRATTSASQARRQARSTLQM